MTNIGEALSSARERQALSIPEVAKRLRIRTKFVDALEREDWAAIGEFVYVRGFLQNYAKLLRMDPEPLVVRLRDEYSSDPGVAWRPEIDGRAHPAQPPSFSREPRKPSWFPWVLGTLTTVAVVLVGLVAVSVFGLMHSAPVATNDGSGSRVAGGADRSRPANSSGAAATQPDTMDATAGNSLSSTQEAGVNLRLQLTQPSWLSVTVDGKRVVYETLPAGTTREFHGAREITLRAGNAGGVVARIDGKDLGALGQAGQVKDKIFAVKSSPAQSTTRHE